MATDEEELDSATRAFEGLQAESASLRRSVEALKPALREERGLDYSPTLGALVTSLASHVAAIERHMGAAVPAEVARREIARVYDASLRPARGDLERAAREVQDAAHVLQGTIGRARDRREQRARILRTAAIAAAVGMATFSAARLPARPTHADRRPAGQPRGSALGTDRWTAGTGLISRSGPLE